jgi:methionine-rich copper-binding protein CopC
MKAPFLLALGFAAVLAAIPAIVLVPASVSARASLTASSPPRNYIFDRADPEAVPATVSITFSEILSTEAGSFVIRVRDDFNLSVVSGSPQIDADDPHTVSIGLREGFSAADARETGAYNVQWSVRSAVDGASTAGSFKFCFGEPGFTLCDGGHVHPPRYAARHGRAYS